MIIKFIILILFNIFIFTKVKKKYIKKNKFKIINSNCKIKKTNLSKNMKVIEIYNFLNFTKSIISYYHDTKYELNQEIVSLYPGSRSLLHPMLSHEILQFMLLINKKYYKIKGDIYNFKSTYSVPDFKEEDYNLTRALPHTDNDNYEKNGLALTLYLCEPNPNFGGTIIYKLKNNFNKEYIDNIKIKEGSGNFDTKRINQYFDVLFNANLEFNKAVTYPVNYWHNANIIPKNYKHNKNRLTITAFLLFDTYENEDDYFGESFNEVKLSNYYF